MSVGQRVSFNGAQRTRDMEGKVTRVGASERGQRVSFNGAQGTRDMEGKVTRVGASERGERASFNYEVARVRTKRPAKMERISSGCGTPRVRL